MSFFTVLTIIFFSEMWKTRYKNQSASVSKEKEEFACVNCQEFTSTLYKKYSEGVIRLTECVSKLNFLNIILISIF